MSFYCVDTLSHDAIYTGNLSILMGSTVSMCKLQLTLNAPIGVLAAEQVLISRRFGCWVKSRKH